MASGIGCSHSDAYNMPTLSKKKEEQQQQHEKNELTRFQESI
jgi:hypothetical protein